MLERLVELLQEEFGADLKSVWLYGSRARGEEPGPESDVDVLVVVDGDDWDVLGRIVRLEAKAEDDTPALLSTLAYSPARLARRRDIQSFFIQEVDRDKIVLYGEP